MGKIRNLVIFLIIIIAVLAGVAKGVLWYYTDKTAKDIRKSLPAGMFNYTGVSTSLGGSASIDGISILVPGIEQPIKIEKLELVSRNIGELLTLIYNNWGKKVPEQLTLKVKGIVFNTRDLMGNKMLSSGATMPVGIPCGKVQSIGFAEYVDMGYSQFVTDLDISYIYRKDYLKFTTGINTHDFIDVKLSFGGDTSLANPMLLTGNTIKKEAIPKFDINIIDYPFRRKLYNYCAAKENKSLDEYLEAMTPYPKAELDLATSTALGLVLGQEVIDGLNEYDKDPKELYFSLDPKGSISMDELKSMNEGVAKELIRPVFRVNGKNIPITFKWLNAEELEEDTVAADPKKPKLISSERLLTPMNELNGKAFNKKVEVHTFSGVIYKGAFKRVEGDELYMTIHTKKGSSDVGFNKKIIKKIYVLSDY